MNVGDLNKVWEVKALQRKPNKEEAQKILERIAKQVQPIMQQRKWRVKLLSEFCPSSQGLLGLNFGRGVHIKLRLRRSKNGSSFYPYHEVLDTMLHELCHNKYGPHNAAFYRLWNELRKDCEELMIKGITGTGEGFDLLGKRFGGISRQPPLSSLRQTALSAAGKRDKIQSLLPRGPKRLGGNSSIMTAPSPVQAWCWSRSFEGFIEGAYRSGTKVTSNKGHNAPSIKPQKRSSESAHQSTGGIKKAKKQDASDYKAVQTPDCESEVIYLGTKFKKPVSVSSPVELQGKEKPQKRSSKSAHQSTGSYETGIKKAKKQDASDYKAVQTPDYESEVIYLGTKFKKPVSVSSPVELQGKEKTQKRSSESAHQSTSSYETGIKKAKNQDASDYKAVQTPDCESEVIYLGTKFKKPVSVSSPVELQDKEETSSSTWECRLCSFLNPPLALMCNICRAERPKENTLKYKTWTCKFCTLENDIKVEKCSACKQWRYSYGAPISKRAPNQGPKTYIYLS